MDIKPVFDLKAELAAIGAVMLGNFYFLSKAFEYRPHFTTAEFTGHILGVEIPVILFYWALFLLHTQRRALEERRDAAEQALSALRAELTKKSPSPPREE